MMDYQKFNIQDWINFACVKKSLPEETNNTWESFVARPVITSSLAVREARAALELIGRIKNLGFSINIILQLLSQSFNLIDSEMNGAIKAQKIRNMIKIEEV